MIESIEVGNESCFKENMQLSELSKINYIFGPNGSGKTTISELLAANNMEEKSSIHWLHDGVKTIKVYNYIRPEPLLPGLMVKRQVFSYWGMIVKKNTTK